MARRWYEPIGGGPDVSALSEVQLVLATVAVGFLLAFISCRFLLPLFRKFEFRQRAYEDAPQTHQAKTGTPTMGGVCFVIALVPIVFPVMRNALTIDLLALVAGCAAIGFIDDLMAIRLGRNRGLRARTKLLLTALVAVVFLRAVYDSTAIFPRDLLLSLPGYSVHAPHWLWLILGVIAITGTIHAVNLTDGLDGLAAGAIVFPLAALAAAALARTALEIEIFGLKALAIPALLGVGACLGFLIYNRHPAKLIMGDTGSLALGALLSGIAILSGQMLLLVVIGGVFVAETLSVMLQVVYFKLTHGKRIFKMSPLHHHFELSGWPETKVTTRFWIASAICSAVGLAIVR
jgi:phospho-N-acetylmuramoyl-pentapeptide-transferase